MQQIDLTDGIVEIRLPTGTLRVVADQASDYVQWDQSEVRNQAFVCGSDFMKVTRSRLDSVPYVSETFAGAKPIWKHLNNSLKTRLRQLTKKWPAFKRNTTRA